MMKIGLCLMVKNEEALIERCLTSIQPLVDYVLIEDTGSTDDTKKIARQWLDYHNMPGEIFDKEWIDFGYNRTVLLERLARYRDLDYALMIDADDILVRTEGFDPDAWKARLHHDVYDIKLVLGSINYERPQLCRNNGNWKYRGVLHEFLYGPDNFTRSVIDGFYILAGTEGSRSRVADKYYHDAQVLKNVIMGETDAYMKARYTFYLAQSWRDCGEYIKALDAYLERARLKGWSEEIFISLYRAAWLKGSLDYPDYDVIGTFLQAYEAAPHRAESLHGAAVYCRGKNLWHQAYMLSRYGLGIKQPATGLFVEPWVYNYGLLDEYSISAYYTDHLEQCVAACEWLLDRNIPADMRKRVTDNARLARGGD